MIEQELLLQAENSVLGCLLIEPSVSGELFSLVQEDDFLIPENRTLFVTAREIFFSGQRVDPVKIAARIGNEYRPIMMQLMDITPSAVSFREYVDLMLEKSKLYRMKEIAEQMKQSSSLEEIRELMGKMQILSCVKQSRIVPLQQGYVNFLEDQASPPKKFISTGFDSIDKHLFMDKGDFILLGGRPSAGKTALALNMAHRIGEHHKVGIFSLETNDKKIYSRYFTAACDLDFVKVKKHGLNQIDMEVLARKQGNLLKRNIEVIKANGMSISEIQAISLSRQYDVIIIDYVQLITSKGYNRVEQITNVSIGLHNLAQSHDITVIALSQLTRPEKAADQMKAPNMSDLRESGQLEQDADVVLLLYLEEPDNPRGGRFLKIAKNKEGEAGIRIRLAFEGRSQEFIEYLPDNKNKDNIQQMAIGG